MELQQAFQCGFMITLSKGLLYTVIRIHNLGDWGAIILVVKAESDANNGAWNLKYSSYEAVPSKYVLYLLNNVGMDTTDCSNGHSYPRQLIYYVKYLNIFACNPIT